MTAEQLFATNAHWEGAVLAPVAEINGQLIDILRAAADAPATAGQRLIGALRADWPALTPGAQQRLARCPYLLIDAGFSEAAHWAQPSTGGIREATPHGYFATAAGQAMVRCALVLAWHLARSDPLAARIVLGANSACIEIIAASRLTDLDALAERSPPWIRPRWEHQPRVWRQLIAAAARDQDAQLRQAQLRGLQLLAAGAPSPSASRNGSLAPKDGAPPALC
jgi:hypothetical protein